MIGAERPPLFYSAYMSADFSVSTSEAAAPSWTQSTSAGGFGHLTSGRVSVPQAGWYDIRVQTRWGPSVATGYGRTWVRLGDGTLVGLSETPLSPNLATGYAARRVYLTAGTIIAVTYSASVAASGIRVGAGADYRSYIEVALAS